MKGWTTAHKPPRGVTLDRRDGLIQGLSAYWLLHEAAGELINDLTSNSQPGVISNPGTNLKWSAGLLGIGLLGTGAEFDRVTIPHGSHLAFTAGDRISLSVWGKRDTTAFSVPWCSKNTTTVGRQNWALFATNSNSYRFGYHSTTGTQNLWESAGGITGAVLYHIVLNYVFATAGSIELYANGQLLGATGWVAGTGNDTPASDSGSAFLAFDSLIGGGVNGTLFQVALWKNRLGGLSAQDVLRLYSDPYVLLRTDRRRRHAAVAGVVPPTTTTWLPQGMTSGAGRDSLIASGMSN